MSITGACIYLFAHSGIKSFLLNLPDDADVRNMDALHPITRMPNLVNFTICALSFRPSTDILLDIVKHLPSLETIALPPFYIDQALIEGCSLHPRLLALKHSQEGHLSVGNSIPLFSPHLKEDAYPCIVNLSFSADAASSIRFIKHDSFPSRIRGLGLDMPSIQLPDAVEELFECVETHRPCLEEFSFCDAPSDRPFFRCQAAHSEERTHQLAYKHIVPLLSSAFQRLTSLKISHEYPLRIKPEEIEHITGALPAIEILHLNSNHTSCTKSLLSVSVLTIFALGCPKLTSLGLDVNDNIDSLTTTDIPRFSSLKDLSFGTSPRGDLDSVTLFLAQILPRQCRIINSLEAWMALNTTIQLLLRLTKIQEKRMAEDAAKIRQLEELLG